MADTGFDTVQIAVYGFLVIAAAAIVMTCRRDRAAARDASLRQSVSESRSEQMNEADRMLFEQHRRMNDLTIAKLEADVALLQAQLKAQPEDADRLHAAKEYHELMVEKAKLEIDSLRLHITEQRKRLDDWRSGHD